jgi:hypothetical protein
MPHPPITPDRAGPGKTSAAESYLAHGVKRQPRWSRRWCSQRSSTSWPVPAAETLRRARRVQDRYASLRLEAFITTKITNAASEGVNRVAKLTTRNAYGFRNPANQRLRVRCTTTRRSQGHLGARHTR